MSPARFRHLDYAEGTPVESLGPAAIETLLDRGDLAAWRPVARAVAADPAGPLAATVVNLCRAHPMYGTSALWLAWVERLRHRSPRRDARSPAEWRHARGLTQQQVAQRMGIAQSDVSKLEHRSDPHLSTLRDYFAASGATLRLIADDGEQPVEIVLTDGASPAP